ncbi:tyrosine-type recombinase/integrase [Burkholderia pyrrocinia]|uniref:tyrosine-type recombinase/integrase n=1 Tax=Burkholderia pyrrocinia TaxID=60550 RepID=UPI001576F742|nr:tyrosine-type recombinase/integrase [Burkholderia pyrrocinia]NTX30347.1 tyrosine-type recombinase/integrase [Burkholderia pyrrocinia]
MSTETFRIEIARQDINGTWQELCAKAGLTQVTNIQRRYSALPALPTIVDGSGLPVWGPTMYLARTALATRGVTTDTPRTYAECLLDWLRYISAANFSLTTVDEEMLQLYRADLTNRRSRRGTTMATATVNLRIAVVVQFHLWGQKNGVASPLGEYLHSVDRVPRSLAPRVIARHPKALNADQVRGIFQFAASTYKLAFRWALVTGIRRFEVANLRCSQLPSMESMRLHSDGLVSFNILRKGGKEATIYAPVSLLEETHWHVLTARPTPQPGFEDFIFIGEGGAPLSRQSLSREFKRCADRIGVVANLHHLRHTYAVKVLSYLDSAANKREDEAQNSLKTLQVLLGHASSETTEIYLEAMAITKPAVVDALTYLYGATIDNNS